MTDPVDTLRVVGGRALGTADAGAVLVAAARAGDAEERLRHAVRSVAAAAETLAWQAWSATLDPAGPRGASLALAGEARAQAHLLAAATEECALLRDRLVRAAGIYEESEWFAGDVVGEALGLPVVLSLVVAQVLPDSGIRRAIYRGTGPWTDEGTGYLASLLSSPLDALTGTERVRLAAGNLAGLARALVPVTDISVREVRPTGSGRNWDAAPSDAIETALARIPQLTGLGMLAGDEAAGVPEGTLAVQRVEHDDGRVTWTVIIPGTQELLSTSQPFDGLSDLDLVAHRTADLSVAIEDALVQAGAGADEKVVLVGHSLGGIVAMQLASSPQFRAAHPVGGVVTAGSPTASFEVPAGVPVLHLENDEELVSNLDGLSGTEGPQTADRVTVTRRLTASSSALDFAAAGSVPAAHGIRTHLRTYALAKESGNAQVRDVAGRIEVQLGGRATRTRFYAARRVTPVPQGVAPSGAEPGGTGPGGAGTAEVSGASSGRRSR